MITLVDAGPLYALINRREFFHEWAVEQANALPVPLFTCDALLSEAHFLLRRVPMGYQRLNEMVRAGLLDLSFTSAKHIARISALMAKYTDVPMSYADACLVCMAEQYPTAQVFTTDSDFQIYRIHRNQRIQVIIPL